MYQDALKAAVLGPALMFITAGSAPAADEDHISFKMVVFQQALVLVFLTRELKYKSFRMARPKTCSLWRKVCRRIPVSISS